MDVDEGDVKFSLQLKDDECIKILEMVKARYEHLLSENEKELARL